MYQKTYLPRNVIVQSYKRRRFPPPFPTTYPTWKGEENYSCKTQKHKDSIDNILLLFTNFLNHDENMNIS